MNLLLTSAGVKNAAIRNALVDLMGKPIEAARALFIPTALYAMSIGPHMAAKMIGGDEPRSPMCELGWKSVGVLELTALPSLGREAWLPWIHEADALLVGGGDPLYLSYWMRLSGLADILPSHENLVYVGLSAGSMILAPGIGEEFVRWTPPGGGHDTLGVVDFSIFPHVDHPDMPENSMADAERWAAKLGRTAYAIDDETAIQVTYEGVDVISEGHWRMFNP